MRPPATHGCASAAFGAIAGSCRESESWDKIAKLKNAGHEIINHSWSHSDLCKDDSIHDQEIDESTQLINEKLTDQQTLFFIFPFDSHSPTAVERVRAAGYLGARADRLTQQMELNRERAAYFRTVESVMRHDVQLAINAGRFRSAVYFAKRLVDFHDDSENLFWLGESYRALGPRAPQLTPKELTNSAKKDASKKREKRTAEEEESELLATPAGKDNWQKHQEMAEQLYRRALNAENPAPVAHRGLGMLYEKLGRGNDAAAEYEKYLELSPSAIDRGRIPVRVFVLEGAGDAVTHQEPNTKSTGAPDYGPFPELCAPVERVLDCLNLICHGLFNLRYRL